MRTLADVIQAGECAPYRTRIVETRGVERFRCRCGRLTPPDMMLEVQPPGCEPSAAIASACGHDRFRCDGCWRSWVRRGEVCPDELRAVSGQPARADGCPW